MNRYLMALLVMTVGFSQIGCNKKKKNQNLQSQINSCLMDPTGVCPRQAAALAMANPGMATNTVNSTLAANPNLVQQIGNQMGNPGAGKIKISSVDEKTVLAHAQQIQRGIAAVESNPNSSYYDPAVAGGTPPPSGIVPASAGVGAPIEAASSPTGSGGSYAAPGDAVREF